MCNRGGGGGGRTLESLSVSRGKKRKGKTYPLIISLLWRQFFRREQQHSHVIITWSKAHWYGSNGKWHVVVTVNNITFQMLLLSSCYFSVVVSKNMRFVQLGLFKNSVRLTVVCLVRCVSCLLLHVKYGMCLLQCYHFCR